MHRYKQGERQQQILEQIRALDEGNDAKVEAIADKPI